MTSERAKQESTLGERLRALRSARKMTQRDLASLAGVDFTYVSKIENNRLEHTPSVRTIQGFAKALEVDELELMELADKMPSVLAGIAASPDALRFFRQATSQIKDPQGWRDLLAYLERQHE